MVVEQRYHELWESLHRLREAWQELRLVLREDRPSGERTLLVDWLDDRADDGLGGLDDALAAAHERIGSVARGYWNELGSPERQAQLRSLAHRRGGEWSAWGRGVDDALGRIPPCLGHVDDALRQAWLDLVERAIGERTGTTHTPEGLPT